MTWALPGPQGSPTQSWRIELELNESTIVQEGLCVLVPCKFPYGYLYTSWFRAEGDICCDLPVATNQPGQKFSGILESDRPRNLTCTVPWACEQGTPPIFSWNSAALTYLNPRTHLSSVLTLSPRPQDHGTSLTRQMTRLPHFLSQMLHRTGLSEFSKETAQVGKNCSSPGLDGSGFSANSAQTLCLRAPNNQGLHGVRESCCLSYLVLLFQKHHKAELVLRVPNPEHHPHHQPWIHGAASSRDWRRRSVHLPSSKPAGLPACSSECLCSLKTRTQVMFRSPGRS
nr:uncharacterized protein LOC111747590 [Loxodonta africana]